MLNKKTTILDMKPIDREKAKINHLKTLNTKLRKESTRVDYVFMNFQYLIKLRDTRANKDIDIEEILNEKATILDIKPKDRDKAMTNRLYSLNYKLRKIEDKEIIEMLNEKSTLLNIKPIDRDKAEKSGLKKFNNTLRKRLKGLIMCWKIFNT